jgi:hypothetical protein
LSGGEAPTITAVTAYLEKPHLATHSTATFDSSGGDLLVVAASTHDGALFAPAGNYHNTYTTLAGPTDAKSKYNVRSQMWYSKNPTVGPGHVVTLTLSSPQSLVISVVVVKGADASDPIDAYAILGNDAGTESPTVASPTVQTRNADDLLIAFAK